jgi:hypothetical protein
MKMRRWLATLVVFSGFAVHAHGASAPKQVAAKPVARPAPAASARGAAVGGPARSKGVINGTLTPRRH